MNGALRSACAKALLAGLAATALLWPSAAAAAQKAARNPDGPAYTRALNLLHAHMAANGIVPTGKIERKGDVFEATATKDGQPVRLLVETASGTVREAQG